MEHGDSEGKGVQSLNRALDILETLALEPEGMTLTALSQRVGLHKSTVHRLLSTLAQRHYVELNPHLCRLGLRVADLGSRLLNSMELRTESAPLLRQLTHRLQRVVHLAVMDEGEVVYLDKVEPVESIRLYSSIGRRAPFHCTGLGKAMAAFRPTAEVEAWVRRHGLPQKTNKTLTNWADLEAELIRVRQQGYAFDEIEHEENVRCVAAPIRDYRGFVIAGVSVTGRADEFTPPLAEAAATEVVAVAWEISRRMGCTISTWEAAVHA